MKEIKVIETSLRDGQQSLWATRMRTAWMLPIAERLDEAGFYALDFMSSIQFDVAVRYLRENPWERLRLMKARMPNTTFKTGVRGRSLLTFHIMPDDIIRLWVQLLVRNGFKKLNVFDALFDNDNIILTLRTAKEEGANTGASFVFCESPVHTDQVYVDSVKDVLSRIDLDHIMIKDSGGLLTPDRIRTLVPALKKVIGKRSLEVHSHCLTGLAPLVYLEGVKAGADVVQTGTAPLCNGSAQPSTQTIVRNLRQMGYTVNVNDDAIADFSDYLHKVARQENKPVGVPLEYDAYHYQHQIPGGMLTNMHAQLADAGMPDRFDDVVAECAIVREELGYPIMVTPFAQFVMTQAVLNVMSGERYATVPDVVKQYALGHFGKLLAPVHPEVMDRIVENGSKAVPLEFQPPPPGVPGMRKQWPDASDEERLLRFMFAPADHVEQMLAAPPIQTDYAVDMDPAQVLVRALSRIQSLGRVAVRTRDSYVELGWPSRQKGAEAAE
jgi:oxaloacetate decarboxylase alpha subunit